MLFFFFGAPGGGERKEFLFFLGGGNFFIGGLGGGGGVAAGEQEKGLGGEEERLFVLSPRDRNSLERQWRRKFPRLPLTRIGSLNRKSQIANRKLPRGYVHFQQPR